MPNGQETELKFIFAPGDLPKIKALPLLKDALPQASRQRLVSTYYDTLDKYLWNHGVSLRVRQTPQGLVQTLKVQNSSILDRSEWEERITQNLPDLGALRKTSLASCFTKRRVRERLHPVIHVDVDRLSATLDVGHSQIEATIDQGSIEAQGRSIPVHELELELKKGEKSALFEFARMIAKCTPLHLSLISKAELGHLLGEGSWGKSSKATQPQLAAGMNCGEAFEVICWCCLRDFVVNTHALEMPDRVEAVHRGRVAIRRLRAALQLFQPVANDDSYQKLADELKWLSDLLGYTRDLDVFQEKTFMPAAEDAAFAGGKELAEYMESKRNAAHEGVNVAAKSERLRLLLVDLASWLKEGNWSSPASGKSQQSIEDFARPALKKGRKKLVKKAAALADLDPRSRHKIRIRAKRLRYTVEFFKSLPEVSGKPRRLLRSLEKLQTRLGKIHDGEAQTAFLQEEVCNMPEKASHMAAFAAGVLAGAPRDNDQLLDKAVDAYRKLKKANPF
jgi:triphosphatase